MRKFAASLAQKFVHKTASAVRIIINTPHRVATNFEEHPGGRIIITVEYKYADNTDITRHFIGPAPWRETGGGLSSSIDDDDFMFLQHAYAKYQEAKKLGVDYSTL